MVNCPTKLRGSADLSFVPLAADLVIRIGQVEVHRGGGAVGIQQLPVFGGGIFVLAAGIGLVAFLKVRLACEHRQRVHK